MFYSRVGRRKLEASTIESTHYDGGKTQFTVAKNRLVTRTIDAYQVKDVADISINYLLLGTTYHAAISSPPVAASAPVTGKVISHEIGNTQTDALLHSSILEAIPFYKDFSAGQDLSDMRPEDYDYSANVFPTLTYQMRSQPFTAAVATNNIELVARNIAARGALNPYYSVHGTPIPTVSGSTVFDYTIDTNEIFSGSESLRFLAPLKSKFRRTRYRFICQYTLVIRAVSTEYIPHGRKFG